MLSFKPYATFICLSLLLSCSDHTLQLFDNSIDFSSALEEYNNTRNPPRHEGVIIDGTIEIHEYLEDDQTKLVFLVTGANLYRKYQFQHDNTQVELKLPDFIQNGKSIYLGDNLVLLDKERQQYYSFVVEGFKNRVPPLTPILGIGLLSVIFDNPKALKQSFSTCECSCTACWPNCETNCGSYEASCSCGGNSQSISCRQCYNASCTQCNEQ